MQAVVTGGAGFIGSHLVDALVERDTRVHVLDDLCTGRTENLAGALERGARLEVLDVSEPTAVAKAMAAARPDVVFHLAAQIDVRRSVEDPAHDAQVNVMGTVAVLEAARRAGARRVVLASTSAVYGDPDDFPIPSRRPPAPLSPYGAAKAAAESYLDVFGRLHGLSTISLRLANVYGPRQDPHGEAGVIALFCAAAARGDTATIFGDGKQTRDYVYVGDVVAAFLAAGAGRATGAMNVGTGVETDLLQLATALNLTTQHGPPRQGDVARSCLDPSVARRELGWSATTSLEVGLERTLDGTTR